MHFTTTRQHGFHHFDSECPDEFAQLVNKDSASTASRGFEVEAHQQGAFDHLGFLSDFKHPRDW